MTDQAAAARINAAGAAGYVYFGLFFYIIVALILDYSGVLFKLLTFSVMLGIVPIGSYFATLDYVWQGEPLFFHIFSSY